MHQQLAQTLGSDYGYRRMDTFSVDVTEKTEGTRIKTIDWMDGNISSKPRSIGTTANTAQVHPAKYTQALVDAAMAKGASLVIGKVVGIEISENPHKKVTGVKVEGSATIPADVVVISMGVWSSLASKWLGTPIISGTLAHSVVLTPNNPVPAHAIFTTYELISGKAKDPEVYPRPDGTVYICGEAEKGTENCIEDPASVKPLDHAKTNLQNFANNFSSHLKDAPVTTFQACYVPWASDHVPIIGAIPKISGAYIATGHGCWGILNSPATGLAISELISDGVCKSVDIRSFDPKRFF